MTPTRKHIISRLLDGHYLKSWKTHNGKPCYRLYDSGGNPVENIRHKTIRTLTRYIDPLILIFKTDKAGRITLNLSGVRRLRNNHGIKTLYKNFKQKKNG